MCTLSYSDTFLVCVALILCRFPRCESGLMCDVSLSYKENISRSIYRLYCGVHVARARPLRSHLASSLFANTHTLTYTFTHTHTHTHTQLPGIYGRYVGPGAPEEVGFDEVVQAATQERLRAGDVSACFARALNTVYTALAGFFFPSYLQSMTFQQYLKGVSPCHLFSCILDGLLSHLRSSVFLAGNFAWRGITCVGLCQHFSSSTLQLFIFVIPCM